MLLQALIMSVPLALLWMILAGTLTIESFIVGYILSFAILWLIRANTGFGTGYRVSLTRLPIQLVSILLYGLTLTWDILRSGIDVALRILRPTMRIKPGTHCIPVHDKSHSTIVAALSAHAITITPGSLVVDFDESGADIEMYVHTLDTDTWTQETLENEQIERIKRLKRMLGHD